MPTPATADGYDDLRSYVLNNWNWIAVVDDTDTEVLRWDILSNSNVTITSDPSTNPATVELVVTGQDILDAGGSLPITLTETEAYANESDSARFGYDTIRDDDGNPAPASVEISEDQVTIVHNYHLPP